MGAQTLMWWYRDLKKNGRGGRTEDPGDRPSAEPADPFATALSRALAGRPSDPDGLLAMSLLVDHRFRLADGTMREPLRWHAAEALVARALRRAGPDGPDGPDGAARETHLYNRFAREYGENYSRRDDLPVEHVDVLRELRAAILRSGAIIALETAD